MKQNQEQSAPCIAAISTDLHVHNSHPQACDANTPNQCSTTHQLAQCLQLLLCALISHHTFLLRSTSTFTTLRCSSLHCLQLPIQLLVLCLRLVQHSIQFCQLSIPLSECLREPVQLLPAAFQLSPAVASSAAG
jgi:hypothetical protein